MLSPDSFEHISRPLVLLLTPTDRHGDARRLTDAGLRVIATSRAESSLRQVFDAQPSVIAIEWLPSFAAETLAYLALFMLSAQSRPIPVLVYGSAPGTIVDEVGRLGGEWVPVTSDDRAGLVSRVRACAGALA